MSGLFLTPGTRPLHPHGDGPPPIPDFAGALLLETVLFPPLACPLDPTFVKCADRRHTSPLPDSAQFPESAQVWLLSPTPCNLRVVQAFPSSNRDLFSFPPTQSPALFGR